MSVLEGMAAGLPVVAGNVPVFEEIFTHGREGLKFPPGDSVALAEIIGQLLDDPAARRRLAEAGRKRAKEFGTSRMVDDFHRLLGDLSLVIPANIR